MKYLILIISVITLSACATPYQKQGLTGGLSTTQLDNNVFQVTFKGNGFTDRERANDFTLLRSAELALENGYEYFAIIDAQQYSKDSTYTTPSTSKTRINANTYGTTYGSGNTANYSGNISGTATTTTRAGRTYNISKPRTSNTIICFKNKPEGFSYNARFIEKSLKDKYQLNTPQQAGVNKPQQARVSSEELYFIKTYRIGVRITTISSLSIQQRKKYGIFQSDGVYINSVNPDSPADKAGIKNGDIILAVNKIITKSIHDLKDVIEKEGEKPISLLVARDGYEIIKSVTPKEVYIPNESSGWK